MPTFTYDELCHRWAHGLAENGDATRDRRMVAYNQTTILSYSTDIAKKEKIKGKTYVFISERFFSNTTAKHIRYVRDAVRNVFPVIDVYDVRLTAKQNFEVLLKEATETRDRATRSRKYSVDLKNEANGLLARARQLTEFFPKEFKPLDLRKLEALETENAESLAKITKQEKANAKRAETLRAKDIQRENEKRRKNSAKDFRKWRAGLERECPYEWRRDDDGFNPVTIANGEFRTSLGITMKAPIFARLWNNFKAGKITVGSNVLDFPVSEITSEAIRIGCHTLRISDLKQLAAKVQ